MNEYKILFTGTMGAGKTMLVSRMPSILPELDDDDAVTVATTCGRPIADFELRIDDGAGGTQPVGDAGEVLLRSGN